jgi:hypothetical protein
MLLATPVISDAATFGTGGSAAAGMPATNLQTMQPSEVWRATDVNNAYFTVNLGSSLEFNLVSLLHTNADTVTQWRVRAGDSEAEVNAAGDQDSGTVDFWPGTADLANWPTTHSLLYLSSSWTEQWLRIDVSNIQTSYFEAGRLYVANAWQPSRNQLYGFTFPYWREDVQRTTAQGGATYPVNGSRYMAADFTVRLSSQSEMLANAFEIGLTQGVSEDVLFIADPAEATYPEHGMVYGLINQPVPIRVPNKNKWEVTYAIEGIV